MDEDKEASNPFSFKKFMTGSDSQKGKKLEVVDDEDIFKVPDRRQEALKKLIISDDDTNTKKPKKKEKGENPFSFKKFLSGSTKKSSSGILDNSTAKGEQNPVFESFDNSLPDFVQDHYHSEPQFVDPPDNIGRSQSSESLELPLDLPHLNSHRKSNGVKNNKILQIDELNGVSEHQHGENESFSSSEEEDQVSKDNFGNMLPDFLSEVSISETKSNKNSGLSLQGNSHKKKQNYDRQTETQTELNEIKEENIRLKEQLEVLENKKKADLQRISELEKEVVEQRKKEQEETSMMEKAMEQVEANLKTTTQRAVNAESTISKLKLEVKTLQAELKVLKDETGQSKVDPLCDVKERTLYVAEQLVTATKTAESSLKQLLSGVDNLKILSQVLQSIDKVTEQKTGDNAAKDST